tara:strand:+ start:23447 stop:24034 length:588 start_codon:yes stop_codon:yes gene_type:complete
MKLFKLKKSIPLLSILLLITLLTFTNQKQSTKLKILIWNTPVFSLGKYIALSTGTGFILSFILTTTIAKAYQSKFNDSIKYKSINQKDQSNINYDLDKDQPNIDYDLNNEIHYDKTLIERDIKDPSPTINASFRVIGKTKIKTQIPKNNYPNEYDTSVLSDESSNQYYNDENINIKDKEINTYSNDWEDDTYTNW